MQFLGVSWRKSSKFFPVRPLRFLAFDEYQSALIPRKLLCPDKFLVTQLHLNDLSVDCSRKESIHRFFGRTLYKNYENAKCPDFQFHNLKFSQEKYLHVTTASDIFMKEEIESCLRRAL